MGGKAVHQHGTGHVFTSEEAKEAGRKGGLSKRPVYVALAQPNDHCSQATLLGVYTDKADAFARVRDWQDAIVMECPLNVDMAVEP